MNARDPKFAASQASDQSDQSLTIKTSPEEQDRPMGGAILPAHGTISAPIVIVGATGTIGRAVVCELAAAGQPVVAVAPRRDRLERLLEDAAPGTIVPIVGNVTGEADAARLAVRLRELGRPLAGVVVAFPHGRSAEIGVDRGRVLDLSTAELADCLKQTLLAQHALARHLVPLLAESGRNARYVIVGGPGSETPWAGYGHRSVAMAATRMLARVLHDEATASGVRVQLVSIDSPVRGEQPGDHECPEWPAASDVARSVVRLLDPAVEPSDAVVPCARREDACSIRRLGRAFTDVPSFLASLRNPTNKITPQ
jgi:NAD(P)-dependent dehydrogenase (short-subunit alcohol dehydrogenase family)